MSEPLKSLWDQSTTTVLQALSSGSPTPGGASTAAFCGAFGVGLMMMAANITLDKSEDKPKGVQEALAHLAQLQGNLRELADQDMANFRSYVAATQEPKGSQEREQALAKAGQKSMDTPLKIARTALDALERGEALLPQVHAEVTSDVGAGAALLRGTVQACLLTVQINLPHVPEEQREQIEAEHARLDEQSRALAKQTVQSTQERISE